MSNAWLVEIDLVVMEKKFKYKHSKETDGQMGGQKDVWMLETGN